MSLVSEFAKELCKKMAALGEGTILSGADITPVVQDFLEEIKDIEIFALVDNRSMAQVTKELDQLTMGQLELGVLSEKKNLAENFTYMYELRRAIERKKNGQPA